MARIDRRFPPGPLAATPAVPATTDPTPRRSAAPRAALAGAVLLAVAAAHFAADGEASARAAAADSELAHLLRAMAFIKASMAAAAVWLADRLLRHQPLGAALAAGLIAAVALMAAAPVLMWHVAHVGTGALMFHAGMVLLLVLGWRPSEAWLASRSGRRSR